MLLENINICELSTCSEIIGFFVYFFEKSEVQQNKTDTTS